MNLRKKLLTTLGVLALMASMMVPATMAQTTTATVTLTSGGTLNIYFCAATVLSGATITSTQSATSTGSVEVCYTDTQAYRDGFKVQIGASDFTFQGTSPWNYGSPSIPASGFTITNVYNTWQGLWGNPGGAGSNGLDIGDIGGWAGTNQQVTSHASPKTYGGASSLNAARFIAYAWDGAGTASGTLMPSAAIESSPAGNSNSGTGLVDGTYQVFDVSLAVPAGLPTGSYQSTLTLTIIPGEGYPQ